MSKRKGWGIQMGGRDIPNRQDQ